MEASSPIPHSPHQLGVLPGSLGNGDQHEPLLGCFKFLFLNFQFIVYQELIDPQPPCFRSKHHVRVERGHHEPL